jgi:hypothetical protein
MKHVKGGIRITVWRDDETTSEARCKYKFDMTAGGNHEPVLKKDNVLCNAGQCAQVPGVPVSSLWPDAVDGSNDGSGTDIMLGVCEKPADE